MTPAMPAARLATVESRAQRLYKEDGWTWAMEQADALRRRDMDRIDWENVIEEIEDVGKRYRDRWVSNCARSMEHLLAIEYYDQADPGTAQHWAAEVQAFRAEMADDIQDNPGLSGGYGEMFARAWKKARRWTVLRLTGYDTERAGHKRHYKTLLRSWKSRLPLECPYTLQEVSAFDHRLQDEPRTDVWPPIAARVLSDKDGLD